MRINTLTHDQEEHCKERKNDISKQKFMKDPAYHPFIAEREYIRALNATKIERLLAKPFVCALTAHKEGIYRIDTHHSQNFLLSSSFDGSVILWNMESRSVLREIKYDEMVGGLAFTKNNEAKESFLVGNKNEISLFEYEDENSKMNYKVDGKINNISTCKDFYVSTSSGCEVFDMERITNKQKYGDEEFSFVAVNPSIQHILGCAVKKELVMIDDRVGSEFKRVSIGIKTNQISFNLSDGRFFATANEDSNAYLHDIRFLDKPIGTFRNHVNSVISVDYSPLGKEIITGSYDKTIRIFDVGTRRSRDVYYNRRMQNINGVKYSYDGENIISGSDDGSIRIWRNEASKKPGPLTKREKESLRYAKVLKDKFKDVEEIKRIANHRFIPKSLKGEIKNTVEHSKAVERKKKNAEKHKSNAN